MAVNFGEPRLRGVSSFNGGSSLNGLGGRDGVDSDRPWSGMKTRSIFSGLDRGALAAVKAEIVVSGLVQASAVLRAAHSAWGRVFFAAGIHLDELGKPVFHGGKTSLGIGHG
jgi:hypothetical protein